MKLPGLTAPVFVHLSLTRHCNFRCFYCSIRDNSSTPVSTFGLDHFEAIVDRLAEANVFDLSFFGGEPFLYPKIYDLAEYARDKGLTVGFLSNGSLIKLRDLSRLQSAFHAGSIALNGVGELHDKIVGVPGAFKRVATLLRSLADRRFTLGIDTLVCRSNVGALDEYLEWVEDSVPGVDIVNLNFLLSYEGQAMDEVVPLTLFHDALRVVEAHQTGQLRGKIKLGSPIPWCVFPHGFEHYCNSCSAGWMFAGIDDTGDVRMCNWSSRILGNLLQVPLTDIWNKSPELGRYRAFDWTHEKCGSCAVRTSCLGGCKVTRHDPPYSLAEQWIPVVHPLSTPPR